MPFGALGGIFVWTINLLYRRYANGRLLSGIFHPDSDGGQSVRMAGKRAGGEQEHLHLASSTRMAMADRQSARQAKEQEENGSTFTWHLPLG